MSVRTKITIFFGIVLLCIIAGAPSVYFYLQYQKAQTKINNPVDAQKAEAKATIVAVSKLMLVPEGEEPTVLQVSDVAKLKDQPFFTRAENGDKVLIYTKAKKAILYRTSTNQIIDVAPVNLDATPSASVQPTPVNSFGQATRPATATAVPTVSVQ